MNKREQQLNDYEAELSYLSAIYSDNDFCQHLSGEHFTLKKYRDVNDIFNAFVEKGEATDRQTIKPELLDRGYDEIQADELVDEITLNYISGFNAPYFADRLRSARRKRLLMQLSKKLIEATFSDDVDQITRLKQAIADVEAKTTTTPIALLSTEYLLTTKFPDPHWAIKEVLPAGLAMIAGRPKAGKSWLSLQMARDVATGKRFLEHYQTTRSKTVYIALEDSERRLAGRMKLQQWTTTRNTKFMLSSQFPGLRSLEAMTADYGLIFVDTFTRSMDGDQYSPQDMKAILDPLQRAALRNNSCVVFIDHMPKRSGRDNEHSVIDDVFGSVAKTGVADVIWGLYRDASSASGVLAGTGRDIMDFKLHLVFENGVWITADISARAQYSEYKHLVLDAIVEAGDISQSDIAIQTGLNKGSVSKAVEYLEAFGLALCHRDKRRLIWQSTIAGREILEKWDSVAPKARRILMSAEMATK